MRHANTWLLFTSYCRTTTDTEAPGISDAATISRFSASGQDRCRRLTLKLVSMIEVVDTFHLSRLRSPTTSVAAGARR